MMWILIEVALISVIAYVLIGNVNLLAKDVTYQRVYVSSDMGLTLNAMLGSSANIATSYDTPSVGLFDYTIKQGFIAASYPETEDVGGYFGRDLDTAFVTEDVQQKAPAAPAVIQLEKPNRIHFTKTGNALIVGGPQEQNVVVYRRCEEVDGKHMPVIVQSKDTAITKGLRFKAPSVTIGEKPKVGPGDAFVTFRRSPERRNVVTAYVRVDNYNYAYSASLGCYMANAVAHEVEVDSVNVVPVGPGNAYYASLDVPGVGVVLELDQGMETTRVGQAIGEGVNLWHS